MQAMSRFNNTDAFRAMFGQEQLLALARAREALVERKDEFERSRNDSHAPGATVGRLAAQKANGEA